MSIKLSKGKAQYNPYGLTLEQVRAFVPSVFAEMPWHEVTNKYKFVSTKSILDALLAEGFVIVGASQAISPIPNRTNFAKHVLRLRLPGAKTSGWKVNDVYPEIILTNAHDRTGMLDILAAFWRLWCSNGCATMEAGAHLNVRHVGEIDHVVDAALDIAKGLPKIGEKIESWKDKQLTDDEQLQYATQARKIRWNDDVAPVLASDLLTTRRHEDHRNDLFTVYQKVEENLIEGGLRGRGPSGRKTTTRAIQSTALDLRINKRLWALTDEFAHAL